MADADAGALVFAAAGCASCHHAPQATSEQKTLLSGGQSFTSDFGVFYAPNISSHPEHGIGAWTLPQFAHAVRQGVSPQGQHYYPAFPYAAYRGMTDQDISDLFAYMKTLPQSDAVNQVHDLRFPFNLRRGVGVWKQLYVSDKHILPDPLKVDLAWGRYLVEVLGHCGECHTPRNALGGLDRQAWLSGAPNPSGKGRVPGITPHQLDWSHGDLIYYFETGFTPDFDSAGGSMAAVVSNLSTLPAGDRAAIASYRAALP